MRKSDKAMMWVAILDSLPTGSGFNSCWEGKMSADGRRARIQGEFQHLSPEGFYDGWVSFTVRVHWTRQAFTANTVFNDDPDTRRILRRDSGLREYIVDSVHNALRGMMR
jgi:hypothetical protein